MTAFYFVVFSYVIILATILINDYALMDHCSFSNIGSLLVDLCVYVDTKYIEIGDPKIQNQIKIREVLQILYYTNANKCNFITQANSTNIISLHKKPYKFNTVL